MNQCCSASTDAKVKCKKCGASFSYLPGITCPRCGEQFCLSDCSGCRAACHHAIASNRPDKRKAAG